MKNKSFRKKSIISSASALLLITAGCGEAEPIISTESEQEQDVSSKNKLDLSAVNHITETDDWQKFKTYWNELTAIDPKVDTTDTWNQFHVYNNSLSDDFIKELTVIKDTAMKGLERLLNNDFLNESEYNTFRNVSNERYNYITEGYGWFFMTRMAPPPGAYEKMDLIEDLEARIDTLQGLKKKNMIDEEMYTTAFNLIQDDIEKFALTGYGEFYYSYYTDISTLSGNKDTSIFDFYFLSYNKNHKSRIDQLKENNADDERIEKVEEQHKKDLESLLKIKESLPTIRLLITDLEN